MQRFCQIQEPCKLYTLPFSLQTCYPSHLKRYLICTTRAEGTNHSAILLTSRSDDLLFLEWKMTKTMLDNLFSARKFKLPCETKGQTQCQRLPHEWGLGKGIYGQSYHVKPYKRKLINTCIYTDQSNQPISVKYEIMCCCGSIPYNCVHASYLKESSMNRPTVIQKER